MNYITYLAHGNEGYINECRFSLLKFLHAYNLRLPTDLGVVIYTDRPQAFEAFIPYFKTFVLQPVDETILKNWIAGTGYVHRAKTKMIQDVITKYPGNVIFFDTDTYITQPIDDLWKGLTDGDLYLHKKEGIVDRQVSKAFYKWDRFLESADIRYGREKFVYEKSFAIWNSGVLGLSLRHAPLLDDVVLLMDAIYGQFPKHIAEQVAVSYCFAKAESIKAAEDYVAHYWNLKEFRQLLSAFFVRNAEENIPSLAKKAHRIDALTILRERDAYKQLPLPQRFFLKLTGKSWRISNYDKKL